jgi:hypothetical protein
MDNFTDERKASYEPWELHCLSQQGINALTRIIITNRNREVSTLATSMLGVQSDDLAVVTDLAKTALGLPLFGRDFYQLLPAWTKDRHEVSFPHLINELYKITDIRTLAVFASKHYMAEVKEY